MDSVLVKDELLQGWAKGGQAQALRLLLNASGTTADGVPTLTALVCELCRAVLRGALSEADAAALFAADELRADADALQRASAVQTVLADTLWYLGIETEGATDGRKPRLVQLVRACVDGGALPAALLKETLEVELLAAGGLVANAEAFKRKEVRRRSPLVPSARAARQPRPIPGCSPAPRRVAPRRRRDAPRSK